MLRLVGEFQTRTCPTCLGLGKVPQPPTITANGMYARGDGHPIPCPECRGAKVVAEPSTTMVPARV